MDFRRDPVLWISAFLAVASMLVVPPCGKYIDYIDFRVLGLLLALMIVVAGFKNAGAFDVITDALLKKAHNQRMLAAVMTGLCFFFSMFITNDVALICFVPLTIAIVEKAGLNTLMIPMLVLQTIAANMGSCLTPIGNPQNLYLYSISGMSAANFIKIMLLPSMTSLVLLAAALMFIKPDSINTVCRAEKSYCNKRKAFEWIAPFAVCILAVARIISAGAALVIALLSALAEDRKALKNADYGLLLTFVFLFIFVGNIKSIPEVYGAVSGFAAGNEIEAGILLSQIISNVPAAMLLSGFTDNYSELIKGVNIGGLGTLIASMASLITYKMYAKTENAESGRYIFIFTLFNFIFLAVIWAVVKLV